MTFRTNKNTMYFFIDTKESLTSSSTSASASSSPCDLYSVSARTHTYTNWRKPDIVPISSSISVAHEITPYPDENGWHHAPLDGSPLLLLYHT